MLRHAAAVLALVGLALPAQARAPEDRTALALTLTQGGLTVVAEDRRVVLEEGAPSLRLTGIAPGLIDGSLQLRTADGRVTRLTQVGGRPAFQALLEAHEGRTITLLRRQADGATEEVTARLLRATPEPLLEIDGKIMVGLSGEVLFPDLPDALPLDRAVDVHLTGAKGGEATLGLRYLTDGLDWAADHTVTLAKDRESLDIATWATITNRSGVDWPDARLALIAGSVNTVSKAAPRPERMERAMMASAPMADAAGGGGPVREAVGGYHLYRLDTPADLPRDATVQVALQAARALATEVILEDTGSASAYHGAQGRRIDSHPTQILMLRNPAEGGAGAPIPAGTVRVYGTDSTGTPLLLGEDRTEPVPVGEESRLRLGESFDVTVERTTTDHQRLSRNVTETARTVTLRNGGDTAATIRVIEPIPGDWQVTEESQPHETLDAGRAQWTVEVPAGGEKTLTFRVRTTF